MFELTTAWQIGTALGLGMLIGFERGRTQGDEGTFAGVRTFALVSLFGAIAVYAGTLAELPWLIGLVFFGVLALVVTSYNVTSRRGEIGTTTEVSILITFFVGALCGWGEVGIAGALAVLVMLLLALKGWLHNLAARIEPSDVEATLKFAIITLIILPLVPDTNYGPEGLQVINPYKTWLMVVLIAGLNFVGYIAVKVVGREHGYGLTGLLGGLVSSTAVTLSFSQRSRGEPGLSPVLVLAILLAWTVMFFRVVVEVAVVNFALAKTLTLGMVIMGVVSLLISFYLWRRERSHEKAEVESGHNPFELGDAIKFGLLFAVVLFVAKAAQVYFGDTGLYVAGALAGLTDVDAIALSMADLAKQDPASSSAAARTIVIAVISNTMVKCGIVIWLGAASMRRTMIPITAALAVAGGIAAFLVG
ncbi:MAG: MgtC/SapB family protein [Xanthomonadales bacterium]|nr:MgtC/SapB family protein [Gammaproteobacteria bacterium]MBT8050188.1 MgtC/SapB family protein [Gammaproteobacteria bacterium]MBT8055631.1 MgtC/SapB family protein [Gammaproteobacteria bacterium]NNJ79586.1 MgtC/SapB family protein [Xanthomonadales bacterium]NNL05447.1 MgtC/SapB family protein [Xanthomonadales bacterium]